MLNLTNKVELFREDGSSNAKVTLEGKPWVKKE